MEPTYEEFQPASQSVMQDHLDGMHASRRPSDPNTSEVKPVLNYSIQTGEEFALEFMRDRVNLRKPVSSNAGDANYTTGHIGHAGPESGSDISMREMVDRGPKEFDGKNTLLHGGRYNYGSIRSMPRTSYNQENGRFVYGYASSGSSDNSSVTMKVLCSFGGKILPRPGDGKLRYVGGETRIIRIRKDISWQELMQKTLLIYNQTHVIKYQLPGEDLDALVSVSSDEDLQNMMEECNHLEDREGSQKLRIFLFSLSDLEDAQFGLGSMGDDSEVQFVVAVNGMDLGSRNNSALVGVTSSANDIHELDRKNIEKEASRVPLESIGASNALLTGIFDSSLTIQSSQPVPPTSSNDYETYPVIYSDQMMHLGETFSQYPVYHGLNPSQSFTLTETPNNVPPHGLINQPGILNEGPSPNGLQVQNSEIPAMQVKKMGDSAGPQGSNPGKVLSLETPSPVPTQPKDGFLKNNFPKAPVAVNIPDGHLPSLPSMKKEQHQEYEEASSTSSSPFGPAYVDSQSNGIDLSCLHPPPIPKRVYYSYSERTPKEQVELLNRSAKSDDTYDSQFPVSDLLSDINPQYSVTESGDNLRDGNLSNLTDEMGTASKPLHADGHTIDNGFAKLKMYKPLPETSSQMNSKLSEHVDPELKQVLLPNYEGSKVVVNEDPVIGLETESYCKDNRSKPLLDENKDFESDFPALDLVPSFKQHDDPASHLPEINWGEASGKESNNDHMVQEVPVSLTENTTEDISQGIPSNSVAKQTQGDILIDIDERFPRQLLSDMYTQAKLAEDPSSLHPLNTNGVGLSINMENHEPKRWSYFQKLAQEGLDNMSLIDQDPLGFSPPPLNAGDNKCHLVTPLTTDGVSVDHADSHRDHFGEENRKGFDGMIGTETTVLQSNYDHSQVKENESMQFEAMMENLGAQDSEYEVCFH